MKNRIPFYILIGLLLVIGVALCWVRHSIYRVPWLPGESRQVWDIEARIEFKASGSAVKVSLAAPQHQDGYNLVSESSSSPGYGVSYLSTANGRRAEWSIRTARGPQTIYYKTRFLENPTASVSALPPVEAVQHPHFDGPHELAAAALVNQALKRSADNTSFARELIKALNDEDSQNSALLLNSLSKEETARKLLAYAGIHSRIVGVLALEDGRRLQSLQPMLQVWDQNKWQLFALQPETENQPGHYLIWNESALSLLDVMGGRQSQVRFSMIKQDIPPQVATESTVKIYQLLNFSIHSLPLEEQAMFKTIMLIPIGALLVVFLRIMIGLKTSGTFMPVLIAVAFVQTQLIPGVIGFLLIVGTGLIIRSYLSRLNLLLIARISAVIIVVILIISIFTVVAFKIGLSAGLSITFFPMIILAWTIERMSILWEEEGPKEVFLQGGGSLLTAVLVYLVMTRDSIQYLTFNFIGIQLILLAGILMMGTYTGYRLTELRRFQPLGDTNYDH